MQTTVTPTSDFISLETIVRMDKAANTAPVRAVKFNLHNVTNGAYKARVHYSLDNHVDRKPCVCVYAKDYGGDLFKIIPQGYINNTDTDYFEKGRVMLREGHPLYAAARAAAIRATKKN